MLRPALRQLRLSRTFATSRAVRAQAQCQTPKVEDAPIVQYVRRRIEERQKLQSEVRQCVSLPGQVLTISQLSEDALSDEDIRRVRKIKELEPLQNAWAEWRHAKQVSVLAVCRHAHVRLTTHPTVVIRGDDTPSERSRPNHAKYG